MTAEHIREAFAQQRAELLEALAAAGLGHRVDEFAPLIRDTIKLTVLPPDDAATSAPTSRLAGKPELPLGTDWPRAEGEPLAFVGQLALAEIAPFDVHSKLPSEGLLSIFAGDPLDPNGVPAPHARVIHTDASTEVQLTEPPQAPRWWGWGRSKHPPDSQRIEFSPMAMLPPHGIKLQRDDTEYRDFRADFYDLANDPPCSGMLCFDRGDLGHSLASRELVLRLDEGPYSFDWVESVSLYILIDSAALRNSDFAAATAHQSLYM